MEKKVKVKERRERKKNCYIRHGGKKTTAKIVFVSIFVKLFVIVEHISDKNHGFYQTHTQTHANNTHSACIWI